MFFLKIAFFPEYYVPLPIPFCFENTLYSVLFSLPFDHGLDLDNSLFYNAISSTCCLFACLLFVVSRIQSIGGQPEVWVRLTPVEKSFGS